MNSATMHRAYLSLGANLGDPPAQLAAAVRAIASIARCELRACSPVYQTQALGSSVAQPDYLNLVVALDTPYSPADLWQTLSQIEQNLGRKRVQSEAKNSARHIDIDFLLFDDAVIQSNTLTIPHPRMHERAFVLRPLYDIAPALTIPTRGAVAELLRCLTHQRITRFSEPLTWT